MATNTGAVIIAVGVGLLLLTRVAGGVANPTKIPGQPSFKVGNAVMGATTT